MTLSECFDQNKMILMEGSLGERLKREYGLQPDPDEFADDMVKLYQYSKMKLFGGCCGTDHRHLDCMVEKLLREMKKTEENFYEQ